MSKAWPFLWLVLSYLPSLSFAHQEKTAFSQILFNERSGFLEVAHRFNLHDAEHALRQLDLGLGEQDLYQDKAVQLAFYKYVISNFELKSADADIALEHLGYEINSSYFWIYQQAVLANEIKTLQIHQSALIDVWPEQVHTINVERDGKVWSLNFDRYTTSQESVLD